MQQNIYKTLAYFLINACISSLMIILVIKNIYKKCCNSLKGSKVEKNKISNKTNLLIIQEDENYNNDFKINNKLKLITTDYQYWLKSNSFCVWYCRIIGGIFILIVNLIIYAIFNIDNLMPLKYFLITSLIHIYLSLIVDQIYRCEIYKHHDINNLIESLNYYLEYHPTINNISGRKTYNKIYDISGRLNLKLNKVNQVDFKYELYVNNSIELVESKLDFYFGFKEYYFIYDFWVLLLSYFFLFTLMGYFYNLYKVHYLNKTEFVLKKVVLFEKHNLNENELNYLKSNGLNIKVGEKIINFNTEITVNNNKEEYNLDIYNNDNDNEKKELLNIVKNDEKLKKEEEINRTKNLILLEHIGSNKVHAYIYLNDNELNPKKKIIILLTKKNGNEETELFYYAKNEIFLNSEKFEEKLGNQYKYELRPKYLGLPITYIKNLDNEKNPEEIILP